jgi:hypothetical protein
VKRVIIIPCRLNFPNSNTAHTSTASLKSANVTPIQREVGIEVTYSPFSKSHSVANQRRSSTKITLLLGINLTRSSRQTELFKQLNSYQFLIRPSSLLRKHTRKTWHSNNTNTFSQTLLHLRRMQTFMDGTNQSGVSTTSSPPSQFSTSLAPLKQFYPFKKLPVELRLDIWGLSAAPSRE